MKEKFFTVTLDVKDINTQIDLGDRLFRCLACCSERAGRKAKRSLEDMIFKSWFKDTCEDYELTAEQLKAMMKDGVVKYPNFYEVTILRVNEG